jgi:branched-subunit amino acid aminotransferase/4-amino-4-deoxychorismate lyase
MMVLLNGTFVPEEQALISAFDRGFLYGDGLFEAVRVHARQPFRWSQHLTRLERGADFLRLPLPCAGRELRALAGELIQRNEIIEGVLRVSLSRGVGPRGYSLPRAPSPTLVMATYPAAAPDPNGPPGWRLRTASFRLFAGEPLAPFKTSDKLLQVLARAEAEAAGAEEALLLTSNGEVAEAAGSNVFWVRDGVVATTPLAGGILAGVTRALVLELCAALRIPWAEEFIEPAVLLGAEGVFLTLSSLGIVEALSLDGQRLQSSPRTRQLRQAYQEALDRECPSGAARPNGAGAAGG